MNWDKSHQKDALSFIPLELGSIFIVQRNLDEIKRQLLSEFHVILRA